jgi:hypothetical protein
MGIRHTVRRGDSLWGLAGRYLGDFTRYQAICDYHNEHAQRNTRMAGQPLIAITDPNRIYVGQILMIPGRGERPAGATGTKAEAGGRAKTVDLKTEFVMDPSKGGQGNFNAPLDLTADQRPGAPIRYGPFVTPDYTMIGELSGRIVLENLSPDRHRGNWELAVCDNENVLSRKIKEQYGQAFLELTSDMSMKFDPATGIATVRPRIAAKAGLGPYEFRVQADGPNHFSYVADLKPIEGSFELSGRKFKYASKLSIMVDITLHPMHRGPKPVDAPQEEPAFPTQKKTIQDGSELKKVGIFAAIVILVLIIATEGGVMIMRIGESMKPAGMHRCPGLRSPLWLTIDPTQSEHIT